MKAVQMIKTVVSKSIFIGLVVITAMSCSKDEEETPEPEPDISFRVQLVKIRATAVAGDGNDALEVYGDITSTLVVGTVTDERNLWSMEADTAISVDENDIQISGDATFTIRPDDLNDSSIIVAGNLMERDPVGNDDDPLGTPSSTISLNSITTPQEFQLSFTETSEQTVALTYSISRL